MGRPDLGALFLHFLALSFLRSAVPRRCSRIFTATWSRYTTG
jgi:hypothetical protein